MYLVDQSKIVRTNIFAQKKYSQPKNECIAILLLRDIGLLVKIQLHRDS